MPDKEKGYVGEEKQDTPTDDAEGEEQEGEGGEKGKAPPKKKQQTPRMLLVDPEKKFQEMIPKVVATAGMVVDLAVNGEEALNSLQSKGPYTIIMAENKSREVNGPEILKKSKKIAPATVRVLASAQMDAKTIEDSINSCEPFRFLKKPFDNKLLLKCVQECLRQYNQNLTTASQVKLLDKLGTEFKALKIQSNDFKAQVAKLKNTLRSVVMGLGLLIIGVGGVYAVQSYLEGREVEDASVKYGEWVLYPNRTAKDSSTGKTWMSVDFRNVEKRAPKSWNEAKEWVNKMNEKNFAGFSDWRLPTLQEYKETYDPNHTKTAYENREDYKVGYPLAFEDGGGYGYWSATSTSDNNAGYFFFIGGYDKMVARDYASPAMSARLIRGG